MIQLDRVFKYYRANGYIKVVLDHIDMDFRAGLEEALAYAKGENVAGLVVHHIDAVPVDAKAVRKPKPSKKARRAGVRS